jgi:hypothetical protein
MAEALGCAEGRFQTLSVLGISHQRRMQKLDRNMFGTGHMLGQIGCSQHPISERLQDLITTVDHVAAFE